MAEAKEIEAKLEQLDKDIAEAEAKEDQAAKEFEEQCQKELQSKLKAFDGSIKYNLESQFNNLGQRMDDHAKAGIHMRQTDLLRLNKIVRDVSKGLGTDWKSVFTYIMAGTPKEELDAEIAKIEKHKPVLQSYKAMSVWKDSKEECNIEQLIEALQVWEKQELADHVKAILYSEGQELLKISQVPVSKVSETKEGDEAGAAANGTTAQSAQKSAFHDPLPDGILLSLAKKIGPAWLELATMLGLAESDIEDIKEAEGQTYQGAFKVLWTWRDRTIEKNINHKEELKQALIACNMPDVAERLK